MYVYFMLFIYFQTHFPHFHIIVFKHLPPNHPQGIIALFLRHKTKQTIMVTLILTNLLTIEIQSLWQPHKNSTLMRPSESRKQKPKIFRSVLFCSQPLDHEVLRFLLLWYFLQYFSSMRINSSKCTNCNALKQYFLRAKFNTWYYCTLCIFSINKHCTYLDICQTLKAFSWKCKF